MLQNCTYRMQWEIENTPFWWTTFKTKDSKMILKWILVLWLGHVYWIHLIVDNIQRLVYINIPLSSVSCCVYYNI
jgi:hypothetical protein